MYAYIRVSQCPGNECFTHKPPSPASASTALAIITIAATEPSPPATVSPNHCLPNLCHVVSHRIVARIQDLLNPLSVLGSPPLPNSALIDTPPPPP